MEIIEYEPPIDPHLADELVELWESSLPGDYSQQRVIMAGEERAYNRDLYFVARQDGQLAGTCHLTVELANDRVGGMGQFAVASQFRQQGIGQALCARAKDTFKKLGGKAIFLGTIADNAARLYHRLGWRNIAGTNVMVLANDTLSPEELLVAHYPTGRAVTVARATSADRIPIIPLLMLPHDSYVLDANVSMFSTRYAVQSSCMGLYPRYQSVRQDNAGDWFTSRSDCGRVVGIASVQLQEDGGARLDGFAHLRYPDSIGLLVDQAAAWCAQHGLSNMEAHIVVDDTDKISLFESSGFHLAGAAAPFELERRRVDAVLLERPVLLGELLDKAVADK